MNKRGLSQIISIVLLILLMFAAIIIIWAVISKTLNDSADETKQTDVILASPSIKPGTLHLDATDNQLQAIIHRGSDKVDITAIRVIIKDIDGNTLPYTIKDFPDTLESKSYNFNIQGLGEIESLSVYPILDEYAGLERRYQLKGNEPSTAPPGDWKPKIDPDDETDTGPGGNEAECGNGALDLGEQCDDDNVDNEDGCSSTCTEEPSYSCINEPSQCYECGDSVTQGIVGEECDWGTGVNSDTIPNYCRTSCLLPYCGDGITDTSYSEQCDDGNTQNGDGCSSTCTIESAGATYITLDGDDYMDFTTFPNLASRNQYTISAWFDTTDGNVRPIYSEYDPSGINDGSALYVGASAVHPLLAIKSYPTTNTLFHDNPPALENWNHQVITKNGNSYTIYLNGIQMISGTSSLTPILDSARFGAIKQNSYGDQGNGDYLYWYGYLDDLRMYDTALTPSQISTLYSNGQDSTSEPNSANLIGWWKLNEGSGSFAEDSSINDNHGTLHGTNYW